MELEFGLQVFHASVAFDGVAVAAEELEVVDVVVAAFGLGDDVVDGQVDQLEVLVAECLSILSGRADRGRSDRRSGSSCRA